MDRAGPQPMKKKLMGRAGPGRATAHYYIKMMGVGPARPNPGPPHQRRPKTSPGNFDANLEMMPKILSLDFFIQALHMPRSKNSSGVYRLHNEKKSAHLACLVQRLSAFTSRCKTDKAGRGALEPTLEDGVRTKRFDREIPVRESHTEAETKKTPDRIKKNNIINI